MSKVFPHFSPLLALYPSLFLCALSFLNKFIIYVFMILFTDTHTHTQGARFPFKIVTLIDERKRLLKSPYRSELLPGSIVAHFLRHLEVNFSYDNSKRLREIIFDGFLT
jgi:hypothetical protein